MKLQFVIIGIGLLLIGVYVAYRVSNPPRPAPTAEETAEAIVAAQNRDRQDREANLVRARLKAREEEERIASTLPGYRTPDQRAADLKAQALRDAATWQRQERESAEAERARIVAHQALMKKYAEESAAMTGTNGPPPEPKLPLGP